MKFPWKKKISGLDFVGVPLKHPELGDVIAIRIDTCAVVAKSALGPALSTEEWLERYAKRLLQEVASAAEKDREVPKEEKPPLQ